MNEKNGFSSNNKLKNIFCCEICNYTTIYRANYEKHRRTKKCKIACEKMKNFEKSVKVEWKCTCGKVYKHQSGLSRHRMICEEYNSNVSNMQENSEITQDIVKKESTDMKSMFLDIMEENKELRRIILEQKVQIGEIIPKIGNTTNNTFNLKLFLNNDCKDALNISEFLDRLSIKEKDLEHTKTHGFCEGISNILMNGLKDLGTYKRPFHCTDTKRETLYIKDNNEWEREDNTNKLKEALHCIADKQRLSIKEWEKNHPGWESCEKGKMEWVSIVKNIMETTDTIDPNTLDNKIIKNIVKEIKI